jgi:acyl carrier protein
MMRAKKAKAPQEQISSESDIRDWLFARIAQITEASAGDIDPERPLADFGLDSVQIAELSGDLEVALGRPIPETAPWEYPTIAALAAFLNNPDKVADSSWQGLDNGQW